MKFGRKTTILLKKIKAHLFLEAAVECIELDAKQHDMVRQQGETKNEDGEVINCEYEQMKQTKECFINCEKGSTDKNWKCASQSVVLKIWIFLVPLLLRIILL